MKRGTFKFKNLFCIVAVGALFPAASASQDLRFQLESISAKGEYQLGLSRTGGVSSAKGYGGQAEIRFRIHDNFGLSLNLGYGRMDISEPDPIQTWNWAYWTRNYRGHVLGLLGTDSAYFGGQLQSLKAISNQRLTAGKWTGKDSIYSVQLTPVEYLNTTPFTISFLVLYPLTESIQLEAQLSSTLLFFEKNFYLDEQWEKRRVPDAGPDSGRAYYFGYAYRNFAPEKNGKALAFGGGIGIEAKLVSFVSFRVSALFESFDFIVKNRNLDILPFRQRFSALAAITVHY